MKAISILGLLFLCSVLGAQTINQTTNPSTLPAPTPYNAVAQGANSALWQQTTYEQAPDGSIVPHIHRYVELSTGLNHLLNGQWVASKEEIDISSDGISAMATNGQHQVYFPGDIYSGAIKLVMPNGQVQKSQPIGLAYFDGSNSVLLAVVTNSTGAILPSGNQVIYTNAFAGLKADLLYTYTKAGFMQDVILRQQPPDPGALGLNVASTRLQMLTEFISSPQPNMTAATIPTAAGNLEDDSLNFGSMRMGRGRSFLLGTNSPSASVEKRWLTLNGKQFLIEEVPIVSIATAMNILPPFVEQLGGTKPIITKNLVLPLKRLAHTLPKTHFLTQAAPPSSGLVLDYQEISGIDYDDFTFQANTTYYISGVFSPQANLYLQSGAVIKYAPSGLYAAVDLCGTLICQTDPFHPAIFTEKDDNSVGETISGSTGNPVVSSAEALMFDVNNPPNNIGNASFRYCSTGVDYSDGPPGIVSNCQFVNDTSAIADESGGGPVVVENALFNNINGMVFSGFSGNSLLADNVTIHHANNLVGSSGLTLVVTNSLFICVTNWGGTFTGAYNTTNSSDSGVFQTFGSGDHYLSPGSPYIDAGSTTADQLGLFHYTTQTNQTIEGFSQVDLGYHYVATDNNGNPLDSNGDGIPDYLEDSNGNGIVDNGETNWALAILMQPANQTVAQGSNAIFGVTVGGIVPIQYQWYFGSGPLANATNATLTLNSVVSNNAGNYFVIVTNNYGALTSSFATLTVVLPPTISITNPANNTVFIASPTNITLMATVTNAIASIVQVQFLQGTTNLGIVTTPPYNLTWSNVTTGNYALTAVASNNFGLRATSSVVNITVMPLFATNTMRLWLKADAITGLTNNAPIGTWPDSSGWNFNATQGTPPNQPLYVTNVLNGLPVVEFVANNSQYLSLPNFMNGTTGAEAFVVLKVSADTPVASRCLWAMGNTGSGTVAYPNTSGNIVEDFAVNNQIYTVGNPAQSLDQYHIYEVASQTGFWSAWINGISQLSATNNTYSFATAPNLGKSHGPPYFDGNVAEVLVFGRPLIATERLTINNYLQAKYALVTVPPMPTNLTASAISSNQISLTWGFNLGTSSTAFEISRAATSNGVYTVVGTVADTLSYVDTNLVAGTTYYYEVASQNAAGTSAYSNPAWATTLTIGVSLPFGNLLLWLKADTGVVWQGTNNSLEFWFDQSGNHNDANQGTPANQPLYVTNALNSLPVVGFVATNNQYFSLPNFLNGTTGAEAFVVLKAAADMPSANRGLWRMGATANGLVAYPNTSGNIVEDFAVNNQVYTVGNPAQSLDQYHIYEVASQTGFWSAWINGISQLTATNNTYATPASPYLGKSQGAYYFDGDIAEVLVFNQTLTVDQRDSVGIYLTSKYGLAQFATNATPPSAPTNFLAIGLAPYQLNLQWQPTATNATDYHVERELGINGTYQEMASGLIGLTNFVDTTALATNLYLYRVRAHNFFGDSYSSVISPPTVGITNWPVTTLENITNTLGAQSADANGTVSSVGFFVGNNVVLVGTATSPPYAVNWVSSMEGTWSFTAFATDSLGNSQFSSPVIATVYLSSNTNGLPNYLLVEQGNNPLNPWIAPSGDTNTSPPTINLAVPANATLLP